MREKRLYLVISFYTTTAAMTMEALCAEKGLPGRLIPLPREISAGCGMAFRSLPEEEERLLAAAEAAGIRVEGCYQLML